MQKNSIEKIDQSLVNQASNSENKSEKIDEKNDKKVDENLQKNNIDKVEIITKKELSEEAEDREINAPRLFNQNPQYPYLAPRYSDFYSPIYNPYHVIGKPSGYYLMYTYGVQDPVTEHPH